VFGSAIASPLCSASFYEELAFYKRTKAKEEILDSSSRNLLVTDFGIWGVIGDKTVPLGYNPWLGTNCKNEIVRINETDYVRIEGTDLMIRVLNPPEGFWFLDNPGELIIKIYGQS
jgi:hypothetical protein